MNDGGMGIGPAGMKLGGMGMGPAGMKLGGMGMGPAGMKAIGGMGMGPAGMKVGGIGMGPAGIKAGGIGMGPAGIAFAVQAVTTSSARMTTLRIFNVPGFMEISPGGGNPPYNFATKEYPQSGDGIYHKSSIKNYFPPK
jgi:hypothetical protein